MRTFKYWLLYQVVFTFWSVFFVAAWVALQIDCEYDTADEVLVILRDTYTSFEYMQSTGRFD